MSLKNVEPQGVVAVQSMIKENVVREAHLGAEDSRVVDHGEAIVLVHDQEDDIIVEVGVGKDGVIIKIVRQGRTVYHQIVIDVVRGTDREEDIIAVDVRAVIEGMIDIAQLVQKTEGVTERGLRLHLKNAPVLARKHQHLANLQ